MQSSKIYLLSSDEQTIPLLDTERQDVDFPALVVDLVEGTEPIVGAEAQLPLRLDEGRLRSAWPNR
jgi:hypothetical protein